jgi:hypothetical protein
MLAYSLSLAFAMIVSLTESGQGLEVLDIRPTVVRGTFVGSTAADQLASLPAFDPVGMLSIGGNTASGTLIRSDWVLTAAHTISNSAGHFDLSSATFYVGGQPFSASYAEVHPGWNGDPGSGTDLALVKLAAPVGSTTPASFGAGPAQLTGQTITFVGYGDGGTGDAGRESGTSGVKRAGTNRLDYDGSLLGLSSYLNLADFDDGSNNYNVLGTATTTEYESVLSPGDSGGGVFMSVDGVMTIVGVNSFVASFSGPANSSYGNIAGFVNIQPHMTWITSIAHAPEPASFMLGLIAAVVAWHTFERKKRPDRPTKGRRNKTA